MAKMKQTRKPLSFEGKFRRVASVLVGLWKFRVKDQPLAWCCTYVLDGMYYDTNGAPTPEAALDRVWRVLARRGGTTNVGITVELKGRAWRVAGKSNKTR